MSPRPIIVDCLSTCSEFATPGRCSRPEAKWRNGENSGRDGGGTVVETLEFVKATLSSY